MQVEYFSKCCSAVCLQCTTVKLWFSTQPSLHHPPPISHFLCIPFQAGERNAACRRNGAEESGKVRGSEKAALNISAHTHTDHHEFVTHNMTLLMNIIFTSGMNH